MTKSLSLSHKANYAIAVQVRSLINGHDFISLVERARQGFQGKNPCIPRLTLKLAGSLCDFPRSLLWPDGAVETGVPARLNLNRPSIADFPWSAFVHLADKMRY